MIDLLLQYAGDPRFDGEFLRALAAHKAAVLASAGAGDTRQVARLEAEVRANPVAAFRFDDAGAGTLITSTGELPAGRFQTPSIGTLRQRAATARARGEGGAVRLWVLDGASPVTDIGSLQATAGPGTLFQAASQFNCLESPGPYVTPVARYLSDPTQGPRASIGAYTATLLRHYAAPAPDGTRFVQTTDGLQLNLLDAVCTPGVAQVQSGYLTSAGVSDAAALRAALERDFEDLCVGVHDDVPVLLGYNWDGGVAGARSVGQVFTSSFAAGGYSNINARDSQFRPICTALLRAAYLGTLLAAVSLGRNKVVLTLIGGGVFGNPIPLIWESICWALQQVEPLTPRTLDVVVNGRNLGEHLPVDQLLQAVRPRGGAVVVFGDDRVVLRR